MDLTRSAIERIRNTFVDQERLFINIAENYQLSSRAALDVDSSVVENRLTPGSPQLPVPRGSVASLRVGARIAPGSPAVAVAPPSACAA